MLKNGSYGHSDSMRSEGHCWCLIDNMFPVWALNILFLKYTLGFPIRNTTSSEFDDLNLNLTNSSEFDDLNLNLTNRFNSVQNNTHYWSRNQKNTSIQLMTIPEYNLTRVMLFRPSKRRTGCYVFSCITQELGNRIQSGDETAGESARDPYGPGKK
ncbi:hypothetical protein E1301_Tti001924 [Triplophysa tibetana]|uniref:Uncharacterized protein n=1 Tax=Triplophysa tibetana TaxID=1572043 RepID=A0A5A9PJC4_9TELE|nr:hypothetical protein E1301_Tti001924 [Triplophysa tibetana]